MEFHERLQALREHKRPLVSRRITSELIGLGHDSLRKYERGEREPGLTELLLIADYYNISLDELCKGKTPEQHKNILDLPPFGGRGKPE